MEHEMYEFTDKKELLRHLTFWSNACGELHHNGNFTLKGISDLPLELQRAFTVLWEEGNGCHEYLAEYDGSYYIAFDSEFDEDFADLKNLTMDELYEIAKKNALKLHEQDLFKNTVLLIAKQTDDDCHNVIFLVPAMESKDAYDEIEETIYRNIWKMPGTESSVFRKEVGKK